MAADKEPISTSYECPKCGKSVTLNGIKVSPHVGQGPLPNTNRDNDDPLLWHASPHGLYFSGRFPVLIGSNDAHPPNIYEF